MPRIQRQIQTLASALLLACALGASAQTKEPESAEPINSALDKILFYQILLGELNAQGGEPGAAYSHMLDAARKANDAKLYQRAVELALEARQGESALQAARAWRQALPNSREANAFLLQILVGLNRIGETVEPLKRELAATDPKDRPAVISTIPRFFSRATDKKLASSVVEQVLADYLFPPNVGVAALTTMGRMRLENGDTAGAMEAATRAQALSPLDEGPALLALLMISPKTPQAEGIVKKYLDGNPRYEVRMDYARTLLDAQRYAESAEQLQRITTEKPDYSPAWLVRGSLEFQDNKPAAAEKSLKRYIELASAAKPAPDATESGRGLTQAYLLLAQIAEQRKDFAQAEQWLSRIDNAEDMIRAQTRRASILARQGKLEEGRKLLKGLPERNPEEARAKLAAEVQLLRDSKQIQTAYDLLVDATTRYPKDLEFTYDQAMLAEKLGRLDEMERLLRGVIAAKPDYHHAYNALGYSLADRNVRLPEAKKLIQKALEFAPGDPFITDSLGWAEFRLGNRTEAQRLLQGAFKQKPDAEIAAHLGEVLWSQGKRDQAIAIWKEGAQLNAENETLLETLKRLRVKL
ncbi:MAG TPA: tetratricopeptide repeat protein [Burkholderiaceae bacterium]|nr:tetratricopeptide repeat protein [Burkholderiaceae bacterium]